MSSLYRCGLLTCPAKGRLFQPELPAPLAKNLLSSPVPESPYYHLIHHHHNLPMAFPSPSLGLFSLGYTFRNSKEESKKLNDFFPLCRECLISLMQLSQICRPVPILYCVEIEAGVVASGDVPYASQKCRCVCNLVDFHISTYCTVVLIALIEH